MLRGLNNSTTRGQSLHTSTLSDTNDDVTRHGQSYFQQRASLAETTIARYNNNDTNVNPNYKNKETKIETRLHPETGMQHPFDSSAIFLSRFPIGFQGCFNCGKTDHNCTRDCESAREGNFNKKNFFSEMWAHKPHTKKNDNRINDAVHQSGQINVMNHNNSYNQNFNQNQHRNQNQIQHRSNQNLNQNHY